MKKKVSILAFGLLAATSLFSFNASALENVGYTVKIGGLYTYGYGNGTATNDTWVRFKAGSSAPECPGGFWIDPTEKTNNPDMLSMLLSAIHTNSDVYIGAYKDQAWPANPANTCKIHTVGVVNNPG